MWGLSPMFGILAGTAVAAVMGVGFGWLAIRRQGIYFAMVTLALAQMVYFVALKRSSPAARTASRRCRAALFGLVDLNDPLAMYYFVLAMFLIGFAIIVSARSIRRSARC